MNEPLSPHLVSKVAERLRALADENRLRLLMRLREGPANVTTLSEALEIGQASVSKHLGVLRQVGLVAAQREGAQAIYHVHDESIFELCDLVCDGVVRHLEQEHAAAGLGSAQSNDRRKTSTPQTRHQHHQRNKQ
jgi:DNA-binding transcriptional ArsR family regulator